MDVGYVYDPIYLAHDTGDHPERGARLTAAMDHLRACGMTSRLVAVPARAAEPEWVLRIHDRDHVQGIRTLCEQGGGTIGPDTVVCPHSYDAAMMAAGGTVAATARVLSGTLRSAYALVRPPGHHATRNQAMGFCLFNNIAIAAAWALDQRQAARIAIVDIDVHHGNGTQQAFFREPRVHYSSLHQYPYFPGTGDWRMTARGGKNLVNVPLPAGTGDRGYGEAFERIIMPAVRRFEPELLMVSIGYDAHWGDPLAWMQLSLDGYRRLIDGLVLLAAELCGGRSVWVLEGGYDLPLMAHGVAMTFAALLGEPYHDAFGPAPGEEQDLGPLLEQMVEWYALG